MNNSDTVLPGVIALQLRLQPESVLLPSVWKKILTLLLLVVMIGGMKSKLEDKP